VPVLDELKKAKSLADLAKMVGFEPKFLSYLLYKYPSEKKYTVFEIQKKSGGVRIIQAPTSRLKVLQQAAASLLYECIEEINSARSLESTISHAYQKRRSIVTNASRHRARRYVLNFDLQDFFPSINFGRVRGFFIRSGKFRLHPDVATVLAQIACHNNSLPQGSPCSPIISELIAQRLDMKLVQLAKEHRCTYSRYADDITLSTNQKTFPAEIAALEEVGGSDWHLADQVAQAIKLQGFNVNPAKTRMHYRGSRQLVTGLVVNEKVNVRASYKQYARAMCNSLFKTGSYHLPGSDASISKLTRIEGVLNHINFVEGAADGRTSVQKSKDPTSHRLLYRDLLFFKYFVLPPKPIIVCEGKTDSSYLRAAIQWRQQFHPILATPKGSSVDLTISFLSYSGLAHKILGLNGGSGGQKELIACYEQRMSRYKSTEPNQPVILLIDNDKGANGIFGVVNGKFKLNTSIKSNANAYFLGKNLYLVKTPELNGDESMIENLFDPTLLSSAIGGKTLNLTNKKSEDYEIGKAAFANFVRSNASNIDFSGFDPLLDRIVSVLNHYPKSKGLNPAAI
jgi:RNA-directed DNA polymerase